MAPVVIKFQNVIDKWSKQTTRIRSEDIRSNILFPIHVLWRRNNAKMFKSDISKLVKSLKNLIHKGYDLSTIVYSLSHVYSACTTSRSK